MAKFAQTAVHIAANDLFASAFANTVDVSMTADEKDVTTFASGGYRQKISSLATFTVSVGGFQDFAVVGPDVSFPGQNIGAAADVWSVAVPGETVGDIAYFGQARTFGITPFRGAAGDVAGFDLNLTGTSRLVRGVVAAPYASRVATGNGTATALAGPSASQSLYAAFHLHSVTGTPGSVQFVVQTDDNSGMTTPTTRITSTAFTAAGSQFASVAGAFASETHVRVNHTLTTFTAAVFSVVVGVTTTIS